MGTGGAYVENEYNWMDMRAKGLFLWQEAKYLKINQIFKNKRKLIFRNLEVSARRNR